MPFASGTGIIRATMTMGRAFLALLVVASQVGALEAQERRYVAGEVEAGARLYQSNCIGCHGPEGDAVPSVNFGKGQFRRASTDEELVRIIVRGVPGTPMPPSSFSEGQVATIVAYLRSMTASGSAPAPGGTSVGDAARGRVLFEGKGQCTSCHSVRGSGSRTAVALTDIGAARRAAELERALVEPDAEIRAENRTIRAVLRDGTVVTGRLLNQDTFSIQLIDGKEQLRSLDKASVRESAIERKSPMPSFRGTLTPQELSDVVSYLSTLKGQP